MTDAPAPPASRPVLVTGAAGFVGSHLCKRLVSRGRTVIALDNFSTGHADHLNALRDHPRLHFERHDSTDPLPAALRDVAEVWNLACPASPAHYQRHPVATMLTSTVGTWRVCELAREAGARLLQVSTSEVYGDPQVHPQPESYWGHANPTGPRSCYDEGKRAAEAMCCAWRREHGLQVRIARLFNCYGPRLRPGDGRVVSNFIVQALTGSRSTPARRVLGWQPQVTLEEGLARTIEYLLDTPEAVPAEMLHPAWHAQPDINAVPG